jgi:hypothetical protein
MIFQTTVEVDVRGLAESVFGSGFETWAPWYQQMDVVTRDGVRKPVWSADAFREVFERSTTDWRTVRFEFALDDPQDMNNSLPVTFSAQTLVDAYAKLLPQIGDHENYDAINADMVIQTCAFGEVVYG